MTLELNHIRVGDAMHTGILSCRGDAPLGEVAAIMARHHVHAVAIADANGMRPTAVLSDLDVVAAIASGEHPTAAEVATTEPLTVSSKERLNHAAHLMSEHGVSHLVVADAADGHPIGMLSTLDLAALYAGDSP